MMKLTGFCIVLFAVLGLINDYSKRKREDIAMLYDFMLLLEKGAFYLAGERMKAPQFFSSIRGKSEVFNEGCKRMGEALSNRSCKSGEEGWITYSPSIQSFIR